MPTCKRRLPRSLPADFAAQNALGRQAEQRLLDELGTNTHKGYIFLAGMLLIARWHAPSGAVSDLRASLSSLCDFFSRPRDGETHGERARRLYHAGGIVREAVMAIPRSSNTACRPSVPRARKTAPCSTLPSR